MIKITSADGPLLQVPGFTPRDLELMAAQLPVCNELVYRPTLALLMPFNHGQGRTIAVDTQFGPYVSTERTPAIVHTLAGSLAPYRKQLNNARHAASTQLGLHGQPPRVVSFFRLFYFSLGRGEGPDFIWVAGHYLQDLTIQGPGVVAARFITADRGSFTVALRSATLPDARRLSQRMAFAAAVTRAMQTVLREALGLLLYGAQYTIPLPQSYATLAAIADPLTGPPPNPWRAQFELLWPLVKAQLQADGTYHDLAELRAALIERLRHFD
ncbi:hypothetical protein ACFQ3L_04610 [Lacticaseibacillus jixianensis]|uniref:Uncharacterized protein n=1 Tax=Lacticaseibacillus jixianensis TaxID=2486012 RepID=A0ABW4BBK3_9LACO|nr:hypothetical protein [Lacticaseibacillus jixianensis]